MMMGTEVRQEHTIVTHKGNALGGPGRTAAKETGIDTHIEGLCGWLWWWLRREAASRVRMGSLSVRGGGEGEASNKVNNSETVQGAASENFWMSVLEK